MPDESNELKAYTKFQTLRSEANIRPFDLKMKGSTGDVNRLRARVRIAKSLRGIELEGFRQPTADAYHAIFKVFVTYTAFEIFSYLLDCKPHKFDRYYPDHAYAEVAVTIRNCDPEWTFTNALMGMLEKEGTIEALDKFKMGQSSNPMTYALAVRHAFAHGHLTAHTKGSDPTRVQVMCEAISELMLRIMDTEFAKKVEPLYEDFEAKGVF